MEFLCGIEKNNKEHDAKKLFVTDQTLPCSARGELAVSEGGKKDPEYNKECWKATKHMPGVISIYETC